MTSAQWWSWHRNKLSDRLDGAKHGAAVQAIFDKHEAERCAGAGGGKERAAE